MVLARMHAREEKTTKRIAAIDMGSNTTRLLIADCEVGADGKVGDVATLHRTTTITRLAQDVDKRGILLPEAITRTRIALTDYKRLVRKFNAVFVLATATSAVRDADNGEAFLGEVEYTYGFRTMLLSGSDEARMTWLGAGSEPSIRALLAGESALLLDIGGGSTEIVLGKSGEIADHDSLQLGSVRVTERFLGESDPCGDDAVREARTYIASLLEERFPNPTTPAAAVGVAGTLTTAAAIHHKLSEYDPEVVHGSQLTVETVESQLSQLANLTSDARAALDGIEPKRAPVIVGGYAVLAEVMRHFAISKFTVSESDILDGIARAAAETAVLEGITELPETFGKTVC